MPALSRPFRAALTAAAAALVIGLAGAGAAHAQGVFTQIYFAPGTSGTVIDGAVIRGESDTYVLEAGGGQWLTAWISSVEDNAVLTITGPDGTTTTYPGNTIDIILPHDGMYALNVAAVRGNATYTLRVEIH
ncbi:hypothetical protein IU449_27970 [Nocardia higoensis]|uniref:Uncharacterized protein n=1 Tax=Nocardia higoensis TaxID=228599 RepID=A0ABS0DIQ0_9NOCA|nr:hypothetical protein [Nocardia higoensis]MBF6358341.1 hypothetical protein [Nocardia higoensis]